MDADFSFCSVEEPGFSFRLSILVVGRVADGPALLVAELLDRGSVRVPGGEDLVALLVLLDQGLREQLSVLVVVFGALEAVVLPEGGHRIGAVLVVACLGAAEVPLAEAL